jgi:23S rRNA (uridine2552-2'-O)-methyltransferase
MNPYEKPDFYSKKAKEEGYAARSVYKLMEIQEKFRLIRKNDVVLDLGCAPGSWTQYAAGISGEKGMVVGIDIKEIKVALPNAKFISGNFLDEMTRNELKEYSPYDGIISDMAPDTVGDRLADCFNSSNLVRESLNFCYGFLKKKGYFIAKIFQGGEEKEIMNEMREAFTEVKWYKPKSSRKISFEIFIIGIGFVKAPEKSEIKNGNEDEESGNMPW